MKNSSMKFQRWILTLNEFDYEVEHIKGKENKVADFFSRPPGIYKSKKTNKEYINEMMDIDEEENDAMSTAATIHSAIEDLNIHPLITEKPINLFKTQIVVTNIQEKQKTKKIFKNTRYLIHESETNKNLITFIRNLNLKNKIAIYCENDQYYIKLQELIIDTLGNTNAKIYRSTKILQDITNEEDIMNIIDKQHIK